MPKTTARKFEAFALHAHHDTPASYADLFRRLAELPRERRIYRMNDVICGFPIVEPDGSRFFIRAVEGDLDSAALVLDTQTGRTRENILAESEVLSQATHLIVAPAKRRAAIEYVRRGAKAITISAAIEGILREHYHDLREIGLFFNPIIRGTFIRDIGAFERIRVASLRVNKPNASWSDHYTRLSELLETSAGDKAEIDIRAGRDKSLSKSDGIVGAIKEVVRDKHPYLDEAKITGTRSDEASETTIRASKNIEHVKARVQCDDAGVASPDDIKTKLSKFVGTIE